MELKYRPVSFQFYLFNIFFTIIGWLGDTITVDEIEAIYRYLQTMYWQTMYLQTMYLQTMYWQTVYLKTNNYVFAKNSKQIEISMSIR